MRRLLRRGHGAAKSLRRTLVDLAQELFPSPERARERELESGAGGSSNKRRRDAPPWTRVCVDKATGASLISGHDAPDHPPARGLSYHTLLRGLLAALLASSVPGRSASYFTSKQKHSRTHTHTHNNKNVNTSTLTNIHENTHSNTHAPLLTPKPTQTHTTASTQKHTRTHSLTRSHKHSVTNQP